MTTPVTVACQNARAACCMVGEPLGELTLRSTLESPDPSPAGAEVRLGVIRGCGVGAIVGAYQRRRRDRAIPNDSARRRQWGWHVLHEPRMNSQAHGIPL